MDNKFPILETFERGVRNENVKLENKGKMSPSDSLKSARILKSRPKMNFSDPKVPKPRGVIFCPYVFFGLFLRGEKSFWPVAEASLSDFETPKLFFLLLKKEGPSFPPSFFDFETPH